MIAQLTNHLWQSTLFAVAAGLLTIAFRKNRAQVRFWLWFSASIKFFLPVSLLMSLGSNIHWTRHIPSPTVTLAVEQITQPFSGTVPFIRSTPRFDWTPVALLAVWLCGFAAIVQIRFRSWRRIRAAVRASTRIDIPAKVEIRVSPGLLEPGVVGLLRPILLLPAGITDRLTPRQMEAVLAHELCHVRRRDNLFASIHMIVEALFWFHPLVWWIGARLVEERERACDEAVLSLGSKPQDYAEGILNVCKLYTESRLICVSGVSGSDLKKRMRWIMNNDPGKQLSVRKKVFLAASAPLIFLLPILVGALMQPRLQAQSPPPVTAGERLVFEVASVKLNKSGDLSALGRGGSVKVSGSQLAMENVSLWKCIGSAYGIGEDKDYAITGPEWLKYERYDIIAKIPAEVLKDQAQLRPRVELMLQTLLADRFQLRVHRESKVMPAFGLIAVRSGPDFEEVATPGPVQTGRGLLRGKMPMSHFADLLSQFLDRPVVDQTGLKGIYDLKLEWSPDDADNPTGPSIFTAVQEQMGLKLDAQKLPVVILVVDHVERPSEN